MFTLLDGCLHYGILIVLALFLLSPHSAYAFDPATDHTCVAYCGGGSAPSSGGAGYIPPVPRGPSPAELARRRQHAEALRLDKLAHAAFERGDRAQAARLFEHAARLAPTDSNIQGNRWYTKGLLAAYNDRNYEIAIGYYRQALRYFPHVKQVQADYWIAKANLAHSQKNAEAVYRYYREALRYTSKNSATYYYINQLLAMCECNPEDVKLRKEDDAMTRDIEKADETNRKIADRIEKRKKAEAWAEKGDWAQALHFYQEALATDPNGAYAGLLKSQIAAAIKHLDDERAKNASSATSAVQRSSVEPPNKANIQPKTEEQRPEQASNPNYPNPPPVYRDAKTPRDYPDLHNFTPAQHKAHDDNVMGNVWAKTGNWVNAMLSYQRALDKDPDGPFSKVVKENLDIAMSQLGPQKTKPPPAVAAAPVVASPAPPQEKPKEIVQSNCTGWMTANGKTSRLCMDEQAHRYCEEQSGNSISRVSCQ